MLLLNKNNDIMFEELTNNISYDSSNRYAEQDELVQLVPSCKACKHPLISININSILYYDNETPVPEFEPEPIFERIDYHNNDLLTKLDDAYNLVKYRGFEKANIFNEEELRTLSQIEISDTYFDSINTIEEERDEYQKKDTRDIAFFPNSVDSTLCEMLCKIGLNEAQINEVMPIVSKVLYSTNMIFRSSTINARISSHTESIGWHFDDFGPSNIYDGMVFTFTISGPGTIAYSPRYEDFPTLQNHIENVDRVSYNDSLPLLDKSRIRETNLGEGLFFPAGADVGPLHSGPEYKGDRIVFIIRENTNVTYNPYLNKCPAPSLINIL
jgi:hypothetical protein